jgi:hypothetical protein
MRHFLLACVLLLIGAQWVMAADDGLIESIEARSDVALTTEVPPQGRWRIYGVNLPETILRKVYFENAARQLRVAI